VQPAFWWADLREGDHFEDAGLDGRIILEWIYKRWNLKTGLIWFWIGAGSGLL